MALAHRWTSKVAKETFGVHFCLPFTTAHGVRWLMSLGEFFTACFLFFDSLSSLSSKRPTTYVSPHSSHRSQQEILHSGHITSFLGPSSGWLSSFPAQCIVSFHPQHVLQWTSPSHITAGWDEVSSPSGLESLLAKRKDSTVLAIFSTHSSRPFTELRLAGWRISLPKLLCSWTLLSGTGLYSSPQSITLSNLFQNI